MLRSRRVVAIVQARMTSSRLPGKVLADVDGQPMLAHQLRRLAGAIRLDEIAIATTTEPTDDPVCELAAKLGVTVCRGSESDVLGRYADTARALELADDDIVVRVTADCPLLDATVLDAVVGEMLSDPACDYASNTMERTFPQGLDVEAIRAGVLFRIHETAHSALAREHVTWHIVREAPEKFRRRSLLSSPPHASLRWTVDTAADLELIRAIYRGMDLGRRQARYDEILAYVLERPELAAINAHVAQKHADVPIPPVGCVIDSP